MNKAFDKILGRLRSAVDKECVSSVPKVRLCDALSIVQEVAEEYKKETYFNLDNVTLHKCPKCGGNAQHRVNQKGSWACGCFECGLFKSDYDHQKAIQEWEDYCKEYEDGWIPVIVRPMTEEEKELYPELLFEGDGAIYDCPLPDDGQEVFITSKNGSVDITTFYTDCGNYFEDYEDYDEVVAWKPLIMPDAYKER